MSKEIEIKRIPTIKVEGENGHVVYGTHEIKGAKQDNLFLLTDYEPEKATLYVGQLKEERVYPVEEATAQAIEDHIKELSIPDFPSYEEVLEEVQRGTIQ